MRWICEIAGGEPTFTIMAWPLSIHCPPARGEGMHVRAEMPARRHFTRLLSLFFLFFLAITPASGADDVANFYRGKQIRFIVGSAPGGTYDLLARIVARHIGAHIPGSPSIIVQNQ